MTGDIGEKVPVDFLDGSGAQVHVSLPLSLPRGNRTEFGYLGARFVWFEARKIEGDVGYLAFNFFLDPSRLVPEFGKTVQSCLRCSGLVIDLRGNPGGIGAMSMGMAGWLVSRLDQRLGTMYMRTMPLKFIIIPRAQTYNGPVAVLVDGCSASTSEIFAGGLQDLGRARVFGTRTAGAALPSVFERLPNGDGFQYAVANYVSEGGKPLEGRGVTPDVLAVPTRKALLEGHDPALDAAVAWIRKESFSGPGDP
jgi:carboxyl-terminal processing protease